ncbi:MULTISPECIES: hypothetical protein [unclassified Pseudodesulfovibrio]|uniref:hypothetical protein n=1 Tax=unclassified Pseudodesulfovibrio TaxID=2661612 RepID=UPI000FEBF5E7|nr:MULTISPECIES: hypothetical protein [unclassified Pseudodesulfovibrio]MCJ2163122.1 hypothetical protein [Pseudodesulfovibrio sp. S3-i]RWU07114.1 hypothetical protein DWB63_00995 [Pseudodesulfovibrio sp. S3]
MKKYILIGAGALVVALVSVVILIILNLGDLIKTAVEEFGPPITQTEVKLGSADISILTGSGSLSQFYLGNPKGFSMPSAVECETIRVKVVTDSLTSDKIIIEEIFVDSPVISYEQQGKTDNFKTIVNNINKAVAGEKKAEQPAAEEKTSETGAEKKIQINNFIIRNGKINLGGSLLNVFGDNAVGIDLPDIHLKDIGKDKETSPAEAFSMILGEMTGNVSGTVTQLGKQLKEQLGKALDGVTKSTDSVGGTIKSIFGSD